MSGGEFLKSTHHATEDTCIQHYEDIHAHINLQTYTQTSNDIHTHKHMTEIHTHEHLMICIHTKMTDIHIHKHLMTYIHTNI